MPTKSKSTEQVWRRLKQWAQDVANSDAPLPRDDECKKQAERIANEVMGSLPERAIEFYGTEACTMIDELRRTRSS